MTNTLAPAEFHVESDALHHWVGALGDLVLTFIYDGSHDDPAHVQITSRLLERVSREHGGRTKLLTVLAKTDKHSPGSIVRDAIAKVAPQIAPLCERVCIVIPGQGFSAAFQRAGVTTVIMLVRSSVQTKVYGNVDEALAFLLGAEHPHLARLKEHCALRMRPTASLEIDYFLEID